jgi:hypothetical protein
MAVVTAAHPIAFCVAASLSRIGVDLRTRPRKG